MSRIVSFGLTQAGLLVTVDSAGAVLREVRVDGPGRPTEFRPVPLDGIDGRVVQVEVSQTDGALVARTDRGGVWRQQRDQFSGAFRWVAVE